MKIKRNIMDILMVLLLDVIPTNTVESEVTSGEKQNRESFYIMKVIYNSIVYRTLTQNVRDVQQSLYMWKPKYIFEI